MSEPTEHDKTYYGETATALLETDQNKEKILCGPIQRLKPFNRQ